MHQKNRYYHEQERDIRRYYYKALAKPLEENFNMTSEQIERLKGNNRSWWDDTRLIEAPVYGCLFRITRLLNPVSMTRLFRKDFDNSVSEAA